MTTNQRSVYPVSAPRTDVHLLWAHATGGDTGNPTLDTQEGLNGEIVSWTRTGVGIYTIAFRYPYPELKGAPRFSFVGVTQGMNGHVSAMSVSAKTATFNFYINGTPTDIPSTDIVYVEWAVRNSGKNK